MATKYFVLNNPSIGRTYHWNDSNNWSLSSGGTGGAGIPSETDDVVIDAASVDHGFPINNIVIIDSTSFCRNLTVSTGFGYKIAYDNIHSFTIYGNLNLDASLNSNPILINPNGAINNPNFYVGGSVIAMKNVVAKKLHSEGGKRIYYSDTCVVTNCPFWLPCNVVVDPITHVTSIVCGPITRHVSTIEELQDVTNHPDDNYILDNDIDLLGVDFTPIGHNFTPHGAFTGTFDGQNHTIKNINFDDGLDAHGSALFGAVGSAGALQGQASIRVTIQNLRVSDITINGLYGCAGLIGECFAAIVTNCRVNNARLSGDNNQASGGLIGDCIGYYNLPTLITNCTVNGVTINVSAAHNIGGFLGRTDAISSAPGVTIPQRLASIVVTNCHAKDVSINGDDASGTFNVGGFVGNLQGTYEKCYSSGDIIEVNYDSAGFFGYTNLCRVHNCYAHVNMVGDTDASNDIAGFCGFVSNGDCSLINCYASGNISGDPTSIALAGFGGDIEQGILTLINCYAAGTVTSSDPDYSGGFIGYLGIFTTLTISNCSWWSGAFTWAIGTNVGQSQTSQSLVSAGYGTDEAVKSTFYFKTQAVYAQV